MKVCFVNIPYVKIDSQGRYCTGPNAGSRWPFTLPRTWDSSLNYVGKSFVNAYAPYPFFMGYAVSYLKSHGVETDMLDFMASRHFYSENWLEGIRASNADILAFEISKPVEAEVLMRAQEWHYNHRKKIVLVGPHCASAAKELLALSYVSHVVKGEYELPLLKIAQGSDQRLFEYEHIENIDTLPNGDNWIPYRDPNLLHEYYDPSMQTPLTQLTISDARGCKFACAYCSWPKTMANRTYRTRSVEMVLDEIRSVIEMPGLRHPIGSLFTDSDTFNIGRERFRKLCKGFGAFGLPWTFMGRLDISAIEDFDLAVENGCKGMRFGVEAWNQKVLDATNGGRNAAKQYENAKLILGRYRNMEFHFTSMKGQPFQSEEMWVKDQEVFAELRCIGEANGNVIHHQVSVMQPFPGTDIYNDLVAAGHKDLLDRLEMDGTENSKELQSIMKKFVPLSVSGGLKNG